MNRLQALVEAEMDADDARRRPPRNLPALRCGGRGACAVGAGPLRTASRAERARARGRAVTPLPGTPDPPDPHFPVYDPHPHPLDLLACWLIPALGDPHWSTPPCIGGPEPEASR